MAAWLVGFGGDGAQGAPAGMRVRYLVLTVEKETPPPFGEVDFMYGPRETGVFGEGLWWQLDVRNKAGGDEPPLFALRGLSFRDPLLGEENLGIHRYILHIPKTGERLEYQDAHTGEALLPAWKDVERLFLPHRVPSSRLRDSVPETAEFLGQVLTLLAVRAGTWEEWPEAKVLKLDRELLVGTSRNFKDKEGHRLPQKPARQEYTYVRFQAEDYPVMMEAGINFFTIDPAQEEWVRSEPVFYVRRAGGKQPLRYPADLYRANYVGPVMFMDEPTILMVGDPNIHDTLRYFSDAAALITRRTRVTRESTGSYGGFNLDKALRDDKINLGGMMVEETDYPSWETFYETAFYQLSGGARGIVHEGRYQLDAFNKAVTERTGLEADYSAEEMLRYHFAFLRGAARRFHGFWGTSIYGQADPKISPEAVRLAYDMGARYVWFWTSDHDHHLPWPEQLALARTLKEHRGKHARPSLYTRPPEIDTVILIPNGYFLSLENLWWVRSLDKEGRNEASHFYRRLLRRAFEQVNECFRRGESFDISVDDGAPVEGYRRVVRVDGRE